MKVSVTKAASLAGVSRTTLYSDMDNGKLSFEQTSKNKRKIEVSELERVYGALKLNDNKSSTNVKPEQNLTRSTEQSSSELTELAVLREKLAILEKERLRERQQYQEQIEQLADSLNKAQENQNNTTRLLEHYTKNDKGEDIEKSIKELEDKIANQEKSANDKFETMAKEKSDIAKANMMYKFTGVVLTMMAIGTTIYVMIEKGIIQLN